MFKIKRDDIVVIIAGKDRGKRGKVLKVFPGSKRALVEGANLARKHLRRKQQDQQTGMVQVEVPIHISNLMLFCKSCNKPVRIGFSVLKDGTKTRFCKNCKETI
jgi:large subunit ribosomal protein L24